MTWAPILDEANAVLARRVLADIADALAREHPAGMSLTAGAAGQALFFSYYAAAFDDASAERRAIACLEIAAQELVSRASPAQLATGYPGVGWAIEHLAGAEPDDEQDPCEQLDRVLAATLDVDVWPGDYDLISGLSGLAIYALERMPRPSAFGCLERIVSHLDRMSVARDAGITWHTPAARLPPHQRQLAPNGYYNLGVAHGIPATIAVLARIATAGVCRERAHELVEGAVTWLSAQRLDRSDAVFPSWTADRGPPQPARSAWCYGDPGVAVTLLRAARALGRADWETAAVELALGATRRPETACGVVDAGFCHGAFGLAHIFSRMFHATGHADFRAAALAWIERGLALRRSDEGIAGFLAFHPPSWRADAGLLGGAAGIGLCLLAACSDLEPAWDRVFLLDVAP